MRMEVEVFKKGNGGFRILRYVPGEGVDLAPRGWTPFSGVYDPVECELERREAAPVSRTSKWVLGERGLDLSIPENKRHGASRIYLDAPSRSLERRRLHQLTLEHNVNA
jgi:hypothetical protein